MAGAPEHIFANLLVFLAPHLTGFCAIQPEKEAAGANASRFVTVKFRV